MKKGLFGKPMMNWYRQLVRDSKYRWVVLTGTLVYLLNPFDISPDMLPIVGWIDDGLLATIAITEVTQILIDRKRNLRMAKRDDSLDATESVIEVDAVTLR